ncbi:hypothetical protein QQG74_17105 [Micromonospora sp. FIMYZ51]|uniref:hypothetical protein n=1 Tax=Micromonospora sp. FIMYZ51 TaxID=3051832 RepID=UPI00311DCD39
MPGSVAQGTSTRQLVGPEHSAWRRSPRLAHLLFDFAAYRRLRAALGGRCRMAVVGGAPLGERLGHFFRAAGVTVLEGYGRGRRRTDPTLKIKREGVQDHFADDIAALYRGH